MCFLINVYGSKIPNIHTLKKHIRLHKPQLLLAYLILLKVQNGNFTEILT